MTTESIALRPRQTGKTCAIVPLLFLLFCHLSPVTAFAQDGEPVLYTAERLIIGNGELIQEAAFLVRGGVIETIGKRTELDAADYTRIDLGSSTVIPALIDGHTHLGYEAYDSWGGHNYGEANLLDNLRRYTWYGFSAAFSAGSDPHALALSLQREQQLEPSSGQAAQRSAGFLFAAGMAPTGAGPNDQFLIHVAAIEEATGMTILSGVETPQEARSAVQQIAAKGIRFIKIWVDDRGGSQAKLSEELFTAIVDEAQLRGVRVFAHQQFASDMPALIDAGVDGFLHGRIGQDLTVDIAKSLSTAQAFLVPNLGLGELRREDLSLDPFLAATIHEGVLDRLHEGFRSNGAIGTNDAEISSGMRRLLDAGVDIVLGTDAGALPNHFFGYSGHRELEIYTRLGMTEMEAIVAATGNAARHLGLENLGELSAGKRASFVVLERNPLDDIRNTRSIMDVYIDGVRQDREAMAREWTSNPDRETN